MTTSSVAGNGGWATFHRANENAGIASGTIDLIDILDTVDVPIVVVRLDFTMACFNRAATQVFGLEASDIDRSPRDVRAFADLLNLEESCGQVIATGVPSRREFRHEDRRFVLRIAPYAKCDGQGSGTVLTFTNVTAFRASIDQAIYEREYTKAILNTVPHPLVVLGGDLRVQTANRAFFAMFEISREALQGIPLAELGNGAFENADLLARLQEMFATGGAFQPIEVDHPNPGGAHRTMMLDVHPFRLLSRSEQMILLAIQDITARKRAEAVNARLAAIVESSDDAIVSKDLNGIVTTWNTGAERIFGYAAEEMIGAPIAILIPSERRGEEPEILEHIRRGERVEHYETVRRRKDGSRVDISLTVSPVKDTAGKVVGASKIARDISEKKEAQARQELLTREIQHRTKNLFAVVLAIVGRSFAGKHAVKDAELAVVNRLRSLAQTHELLIDREWQGADLVEVVRTEVSPYGDRVHVNGPHLILTARAAQNFALAVHELATNAAKYGALSNATGRVHISWSKSTTNGSRLFTFRWQEQGGPPVAPPAQKGFGSAVLEQVMAEHFDVPPRIEFAPGGVCYEVIAPLEGISEQA